MYPTLGGVSKVVFCKSDSQEKPMFIFTILTLSGCSFFLRVHCDNGQVYLNAFKHNPLLKPTFVFIPC